MFQAFRLAADGTQLLRGDEPIALPPKVLQTLLVLVRRAGEVVTKAELLEQVWPDSFVEESGLTRNISVLRQALRPDADKAIITVARLGYRFIAPVTYDPARSASCLRAPADNTETEREDITPTQAPMAADDDPAPHAGRIIVGRQDELATLVSAFAAAEAGVGQLIAVTGEAGIGKTTIVDQFVRAVRSRSRVGRGRCSRRYSGAEPHLPLIEALQELSGADAEASAALRRFAPTWYRSVVPGAAADDDRPDLERPAGSAERLLHELTVLFRELSQDAPLVVVLEDLHWCDVSSVDALTHLSARLRRMRLVLLLTYRPADINASGHPLGRLAAELVAREEMTPLNLPLLRLSAVHEYVTTLASPELPDLEFTAAVHRRTEGNPLFMVDLVRYLRDRSATGGRLRVDDDLPGSLKLLIAHTLESLPEDLRQLLSLGAIQGYEFDSLIVADVSGCAPAAVEERLSSAERVYGLLTAKGEHTLPDGRPSLRYQFVHVLYQEALYAALVPSRRIECARRVGELLLRAHGGMAHAIAGQLAVLFETGREFWLASEHFLAASRNAARRFAFHEASELSRRGLQCLSRLPQENLTLRRETDLTFARFVALASLEGYGSSLVEDLMHRLVQVAEVVGDVTATAAALTAQWGVHMAHGECAAAKHAGERLQRLASEPPSPVLLMNAGMQIQIAAHHLGEFSEAERCTDAILAAAPAVAPADRLITIFDPVVASLAESSRNSWIVGRLARAEEHSAAALAHARQSGHPDSLAFAHVFDAWLHGYREDWRAALSSAEAGIAVAESAGTVQTLAWNRCVRGWVRAHLGQVEEGIAELAQAIEASKRILGWVAMPQFSAMMAEGLLLQHRPSDAERWLREASEFGRTHRDCYFSAEIHRLTARCSIARGEHQAALAEIRAALEVAREQGALMFELRAALDLAAHVPGEGRRLVQRVRSSLPEPRCWPDVERAAQVRAGHTPWCSSRDDDRLSRTKRATS